MVCRWMPVSRLVTVMAAAVMALPEESSTVPETAPVTWAFAGRETAALTANKSTSLVKAAFREGGLLHVIAGQLKTSMA